MTMAVECLARYGHDKNREKLLAAGLDAGPEWVELEEPKKLVWREWYVEFVNALADAGLAPIERVVEYGVQMHNTDGSTVVIEPDREAWRTPWREVAS
jgi:hypothetical protein